MGRHSSDESRNQRSRSRNKDKHKKHKHKSKDKHKHKHRDRSQEKKHKHKKKHKHEHKKRDREDSTERYRHNRYHRDREYSPNRPKVVETQVEPPKCFVISEESQLSGSLKVALQCSQQVPEMLEPSKVNELKNQITPIQRLWTSHIKQYLNISEFVEIFRKGKSLAEGRVEYGHSIVRYERQPGRGYAPWEEQSQIFSRAYFKLWEILNMGVLEKQKNKPMTIACVAEGPGGFIHALVDYRLKQHRDEQAPPKDKIHAITLRIDQMTRNAKDWRDYRASELFDRLRKRGHHIQLSYGATGTGDLLIPDNIEHFASQVGVGCELVTGDGGIECIGDKEFEYQQVFNVKLFLGEIIAALRVQAEGGTFILKIYDCCFILTRQLLMLLALYYQKVQIVKPITSRPGNSQKYVLCEGFRGISKEELQQLKFLLIEWARVESKIAYFQNEKHAQSALDFSHLPQHEILEQRIKQSNDAFLLQQQQKLQQGLKLAEEHPDGYSIERQLKKKRFRQQVSFAYAWCKQYGISTIEVESQQ